MKLHELPPDHRLRNVPIGTIEGVLIVCRHTRSSRNPRTWKIKGDTFNRLGETWRTNFDFVLPVALACVDANGYEQPRKETR